MTPLMRVRWLVVAAALGMLCVGPPAQAKPGAVARAKRAFRKAEKHFAAGEFREALTLYQKAYEAKPLAGFHFNMGQCYRELEEYEKAIYHFRQYLEESRSPRHKEDAEELIALSEQSLEERRAAEKARLDAEKAPVEPAPVVTPPPAQVRKKSSRRRLSPVYFWSAAGASAALLLTGTITGAVALSKSSTYKDPDTPAQDLQGLKDSGEALKVTSSVMFGLGLAGAAGTAALYFFTDFGSKERAVSAAPVRGGGMVTVGGSF